MVSVTIETILKKFRNEVSSFNDKTELSTTKHGVWSLKKNLVLYDYIPPFLKILRNYNYRNIHYYDPFSGSGFFKIGNKIMPGTALVPLLVTKELIKNRKGLQFDTVNYSDIVKRQVESLRQRANLLRGTLQTTINAETNEFKLIALNKFKGFPPLPANRYNDAYLVMLDPYGFDVEWKYLERIAKSGAVDIILTFPSTLANWTKTMENSQDKLTKMYGGEEYQEFDTAEDFVENYCEKIENIPTTWKLKTKSIEVHAGKQAYHIICISRSNGALRVFADMQKKYGDLQTEELEKMFLRATEDGLSKWL